MNGYEATKAIRVSDREDLKTIPIIAVSADAFSEHKKCGCRGSHGKYGWITRYRICVSSGTRDIPKRVLVLHKGEQK